MSQETTQAVEEQSAPHYLQSEEYENRLRKLQEIRALGVEPYPHKYNPSHRIAPLQGEIGEDPVGNSDDAMANSTPVACVAGRLVLFRAMGKNAFGHVQDETGRLQVMFNRDTVKVHGYDRDAHGDQAPTPLKFIEKKIDLGDIIGIEGRLFRTGKGELTLLAQNVTLLCKSLLPLPDKHAGLSDKETRYRKRWLDLISHQDVAHTFRTRSRIMRQIRSYLEEQDFMEVETPVVQSLYGGAEARPFETELHALRQHMYMRIALELPLKKLLVGGVERIFEMGKVFRNEGMDRNHNPEFTMMEAYAAYWDYNDMMRFVENLYERIALDLFADTKVPAGVDSDGNTQYIDVKAPWERLTMKDSIKKHGDLDVDTMSDDDLRAALVACGEGELDELKAVSRGLLIARLFEAKVEDKLIQPVHITDHPIETTPLCKLHRDPAQAEQQIVERFESFIGGQEVCNAYSELNDPLKQRELLEGQVERREAGDDEAHPLDEEFLEAIYQGMPPAGGVGIGIDRLTMLFTQAASIRDVLYFPWMKPQT